MPKLSIITINYNDANGLRKTIESVIQQSSNDFEYIIIDGASTDESVEVIKKYEDKIAYWTSEADTGIYNAMNKGIKAAKGDYCQFLNSGDLLANKNVTEQMLNNMPKCSILYGNVIKDMLNGKSFVDKNVAGNPLTMFNFYSGTINHSSAYIKRSLFDKYGFYDESLKIVSDWKFYLIAIGLHNEKVAYKNINVSIFDMQGISNSQPELEQKERKKVLQEYIPENILKDYENHCIDIKQMQRIKKYKWVKSLFWLTERFLFKYEKLINKTS